MKGMYYNGFGAWCAAYAFLNTVKSTETAPGMYELLSGVPFGLKHSSNHKFKILTPFVEPCFRVADTAKLLGYRSEHWRFGSAQEAVQFMADFRSGQRIMMGPINMGWLRHLPQNMMYGGQSHYIAIEKRSQDHYRVIDSECVLGYEYTAEKLCGIIGVDRIPEAKGGINGWRFERMSDEPVRKERYRQLIIEKARQNLMQAEHEGQGSRAVLACHEFLADKDIREWSTVIYHEINYLIQRKELAVRYQTALIEQELDILCEIRNDALLCKSMDYILFKRLADCEHALANKIS